MNIFECTHINTHLCFYAYTPTSSIWVRFSISVFAEITGCSVSCHTECLPQKLTSVHALSALHRRWSLENHQHNTHTYHKHSCMNTNRVTVLHWSFSYFFSPQLIFLHFWSHLLAFSHLLFSILFSPPLIPLSSSASLWGGLMWAPDVEADWLETERAEGFPIPPSPLLPSSLKYLISLCFVPFSFCSFAWFTTTSAYEDSNMFTYNHLAKLSLYIMYSY